MNKYYFEILETEYTMNVIEEVTGSVATFEGTEKDYKELMEYEVFTLDTIIGDLFFHEEDIKLIGVYDTNIVKTYNECIESMDKFERTSCFDEIFTECKSNLNDAIYNLKLILDRLIEESETTEQIKFYNKMLSKINTVA